MPIEETNFYQTNDQYGDGVALEVYRGEYQLIAARKQVEDIALEIGADSLSYLSHEGLRESVSAAGLGPCMACFDGKYPVPVEVKP